MSKGKNCPYCGRRIRIGQVSEYLLHGTGHAIKCDGCGRMLRPSRYPLSFWVCYAVSMVYTVGAMSLMLFVFRLGFLKSLLIFLGSAVILLAILCAAIIATTRFDGKELTP